MNARAAALFTTALVLALAEVACDPSEPTSYTPSYDPGDVAPIPVSEFCAELARNVCAVMRPCCQASPFAFDETRCRAVSRSLCEARRTKAQDDGYVYDAINAGRCVAGTPALVRSCELVDWALDPLSFRVADACQNVWHGDLRLGEPCSGKSLAECAPTEAHDQKVLCFSGTCRVFTFLKGGEDCASFGVGPSSCAPCGCAHGLVCRGDPQRCTALYHPLGAACQVDGECAPPRSPPLRRCDCGDGRACLAGELGRCALLPGIGSKCIASTAGGGPAVCALGARCDHDKGDVCVEAKPLGASCSENGDCITGRCGGVCVPSGIADPTTCDGSPLSGRGGGGFVELSVSIATP